MILTRARCARRGAPKRSRAACESTGSNAPGALQQARVGARARDQAAVAREARVAQVAGARLAHARELALAAHAQVELGELEAARMLDERLQPPLAELARLLRLEQEAVRLVAAAPDPPAQLVQLREAEAVGVLDHHRGRVRHVDADLDHGRRDEHVHLGGRECAHRRRALGRLLPPVHEPDHERREHLDELGVEILRGARLHRLRALDERAHDVGLAAVLAATARRASGGSRSAWPRARRA